MEKFKTINPWVVPVLLVIIFLVLLTSAIWDSQTKSLSHTSQLSADSVVISSCQDETRTTYTPCVSPDEKGNTGCSFATTSPDPEPCIAAQQMIRSSAQNLVNSDQFKKWKAANPGEWSKLQTYGKTNSSPPILATPLGAALVNVIQAYWYARASEPIIWPAPYPPPTGTDKKPPTPPGNLKITVPP